MLHGGEQPQPTKRQPKPQTGNQEPRPLVYPGKTGKSSQPPQTDAYALGEGMIEPRTSNSVVSLHPQAQRTTSAQPSPSSVPPRRQQGLRNLPRQPRLTVQFEQKRRNVHWLLPLGVGMLAMLAVWITGSWVLAWGIQRYNDIRYGFPRTYQTDAVVGHGDSKEQPSHFIAINLNRQAIVIELKGGDPARSFSYVAPFYIAGDSGELVPVTVEFRDVAGDNKPDMLIHIHVPQQQIAVFVNDGKGFRPSNGNDKIRL